MRDGVGGGGERDEVGVEEEERKEGRKEGRKE